MFKLKENDFVRHSKLTLEQYLAFCEEAEKQGWCSFCGVIPNERHNSVHNITRLFTGDTKYFGTSGCDDGEDITQKFLDYLEENKNETISSG